MFDPTQIIEQNNGPELAVFESEVEKLSENELRAIVVAEGILTNSQAENSWDFELRHIIAEASWQKFFDAYFLVTGKRFILDRHKDHEF